MEVGALDISSCAGGKNMAGFAEKRSVADEKGKK